MKLNESHATLLLIRRRHHARDDVGDLTPRQLVGSRLIYHGGLVRLAHVKQNIWNFPLGLVNVATFCVVFFQSRLYADAGLQMVYFALGVNGWYLWLHGGTNRTALKVSRASDWELAIICVFIAVSTLGLWRALASVGGSASFADALATSISLASQWLLNRKRLESWIGWIIVDIIYVPLYRL